MLAFSPRLLERNPFQRLKHIPGQPVSYLQNPKVATKSLELSLWRAYDPDGAPENPHAVKQGPFIRHPRELSEQSFASLMQSKFFSAVRNPYSRFLSAYLNKVGRRPWFKMSGRFGMAPDSRPSIGEMLSAIRAADQYTVDHHFRPQHINLLAGLVPLDFLGYFERLDDVQGFLARFGLVLESNRRNATDAGDRIKELLDESTIGLIQAIYQKDFELYGYALDPSRLEPEKPVSNPDSDRSALETFLRQHMKARFRVA